VLTVAGIDDAALRPLDGDRVGSSSSLLIIFLFRAALVTRGGDSCVFTMMEKIDGDVKELYVEKEATCFWIICTRWLQVRCFPYQMAFLVQRDDCIRLEIYHYVKFN
jgi:hypothetical protein